MKRYFVIILHNWHSLFLLMLCVPVAIAQSTPAPRILILGDSISAAYGLPSGTGWVNLLEARLKKMPSASTLHNSSISGETSAGGRARIVELLKRHQPTIVVLELGGNDALRGFPLKTSYQNLLEIVQLSQRSGAKVLILGMRIPSNYGPEYTTQFANMFIELGKNTQSALVPFFLEGIATQRDYFQEDGIHPNQRAQSILLKNMEPALLKLLQ